MKESEIQAKFQLMDNYISEFSLNVFNKVQNSEDIEFSLGIGFRIVNVEEKDLVGQIELRYDVDVSDSKKNDVAKIVIVMNGLFQGIRKYRRKYI